EPRSLYTSAAEYGRVMPSQRLSVAQVRASALVNSCLSMVVLSVLRRAVLSRDTRTQPWSGTPQTPGRSRARTEFAPQAKSESCQGLPHLPVQVGTPPIRTGFVAPVRRTRDVRSPCALRAAPTATPARARFRRWRRPP